MTRNLRHILAGAGILLGLLPAVAPAQQPTTVSGRVTAGGTPLQGVVVSIPTLNVGGYSDAEGRYTFTVPGAATGRTVTVTARRIGYQPVSAQVNLSGSAVTQDFALSAAAQQLQGVVVTALGVRRERSQLGTAQQQLSSEELTQTRAMNVVNQIQGKVSGVSITGSGTQGGSTNIVIRGYNSIAGNNQPLFVVDGIPVSNENRQQREAGQGRNNLIQGWDWGNAISDLNPDDIETFTVLKGPNAAALYGSRAANGVVVITTKKGVASGGRIRTELNTNYTWERPSILPNFQDQYGQGSQGLFRYVNGANGGTCDGCDQSWGPMLDGRLIDQFHGPQQPWVPNPDNVSSFFETGRTFTTTLAASGGTERANARLSVGVDNVDGYVPNNFFQKASGLLSGTLQVTPRLNTNATLQYIRNNGRNRPGTGYLNSIMEQFFWFGRQVDIDQLKEGWRRDARENNGPANREWNWNYNYHNNPYWLQFANPVVDSRDRFIASAQASYDILPWMTATVRSGSDIYRLNIDRRSARGNLTYSAAANAGGFMFANDYRNEHNTDVMVRGNRDLMSNLSLDAMVGGGLRREQFTNNEQETRGLTVPGIYTVTNAAITPTLRQQTLRRHVNSAYGSAAMTWNRWLTLEGTARNDWSSTLPRGANSYFYPSVNASVILTDALPVVRNNILTYAKLRGSVAEVGNDAQPYQLQTTYTGISAQFRGNPQFTLGQTLANAELKPELTRSTEAGIELGFWNGRATLDATYYDKETRNQIFNVTVSSASGFQSKAINAGLVTNEGFEALFSVTPVELANGFRWTSTFNYGRNKNRVAELTEGVTSILLGNGIFGDVRLEARAGQPYGALYGQGFARDEQGRLLTDGGAPVPADTFTYMGSIQPDWTGGWNNQLSFRNWTLNVLFDIRRGGKLASYTNSVGEYSGVLESSLRGREVDWDDPGILVDGIDIETGQPNTIRLTAEEYFQSFFPAIEPYVYDASYVKLREVRVGFELPTRWANRFNAQSVSLALTGRNLITWTDVPNVDPEFTYTSGNFQGIEYAIPANPRSVGFSVRVAP